MILEWTHMTEADTDEILYYIAEDNVEVFYRGSKKCR